MKKIFFSTLALIAAVTVNAQEGLVLAANKLYDAKSYSEAIPKYEKVIKKDSNNVVVLAKLGDCYRFTNNSKGQVLCYGKLVDKGNADAAQKLYYGQALMALGRYEDAKRTLEGYTTDERGSKFAKAISSIQNFSKNSDAYRVDTVSFNSKENDFSPAYFAQGKLVFTSSRSKTQWINKKHGWTGNNYYAIYSTEKGSDGKYLKPTKFMRDLESKYNDGPICFSQDKTTVYFTRNTSGGKKGLSKDGTYKLKVLEAKLNIDGFEKVNELSFNSLDYNCAHPTVSSDGKTLYFTSDMPGGFGGLDIWYVKSEGEGKWSAPVNMGEKLNSKGNEMFPYISFNGVLYFSSNGHEGLGGLDIFEAKIKADGTVGRIYNMGVPVNSASDDFGIILSEDMRSGYISSNRKNGNMDDDIYSLNILREVKRGKDVIIKTVEKDNESTVVPYAKVKYNNDSVTTNDKGEFTLFIEEDTQYNLTATADKYFETKDSLNTKMSDKDEFTKTIPMEKDPDLSLLAFVLDAKSNQSIDGVKISIKDNSTGTDFDNATTSSTGEYRKSLKGKKIGDKLNFKITLEKDGYLTKTLNFEHNISKPGEVRLNELLNMTIGKIEVGGDLAKMIDMKPIYFDLGKSKIRPDAAVELDKVVKIMKEYPGMTVELGSHTDCRSSAASNMKLSTARAKASATYIASKGIPRTRITGKGFGETKLLNGCACEGKLQSNCSEDDHAKNRRTEFIITKLK